MIIKKIELGGELVAVVYSYGPEGGPGYAALVTFSPAPVITQLGEFADAAAANTCVAAVTAQLRGLSVRIVSFMIRARGEALRAQALATDSPSTGLTIDNEPW